jgi:high-affinity iron transporter
MTAPTSTLTRCLSFLLLCFAFPLLAVAQNDSARALHLLGYIGADYPRTVAAGEVIDEPEYREQQEFMVVLQGLLVNLPAKPGRAKLEQDLHQLEAAIRQRQEGGQVARQARQIATELVELYQLQLTPAISPDPTRGAPLFAEQCSVCHGANGAGDGPAAIGMQPAPSNLRDQARLDQLSLYDIYNTIGLGVDGTDMAGFADELDERQRWDLASYIASLNAPPVNGGDVFSLALLAGKTPAEIAASQGEADAARFRAQRANPPQPQRSAAQYIEHTRQMLAASLEAYKQGDASKAYELSVAAYLEGFELVESGLNNIDAEQRKATERALMAYRKLLQDGAPAAQATQALAVADRQLQQSAELLSRGGMSASLSFISSLLILLREGVEAILVLAAILAFLNKTGQQQATRSVHLGWGLALLAGVLTWAVAAWLLDIGGAQREVLEGSTAIFASVMLLWVGVWMHGRRQADAWQGYLQQSLLGSRGRYGFAMLAFIAVYRELFEVILFYETLWLQAGAGGQDWVLLGAGAALVLLLGLAWVILRGAARLPLGTFFSVNAALMCALAVVFAGHGVKALQEAGVLPLEPVHFIELSWLGVHPDGYSLSAQALVLLLIALFYGRDWWQSRQRAELTGK